MTETEELYVKMSEMRVAYEFIKARILEKGGEHLEEELNALSEAMDRIEAQLKWEAEHE